jgi:hypothetical protein
MPTTIAGPSIVKSVRQRQLLNAWLRLFAKHDRMPEVAAYKIDRLEEEKPDMMVYAVTHETGAPRYQSIFEGQRLIDAFGTFGATVQGRFLDEVIDPERAAAIIPIYDECIAHRRPSYTVRRVTDINGRDVDYERLLLPFGGAQNVDTLIAFLKSISIEGRFEQKDLMRRQSATPDHVVHAIIDRDHGRRTRPDPVADCVVEL